MEKRDRHKRNVVVMSEDEFAGWQETVHLLNSPRNAERLMSSIRQANAGRDDGLKVPNATTRAAMEEARTMSCARFATPAALFDALDAKDE